MIMFETKNSIYSVTVENGKFKIIKAGEKHHSPFNVVGQARYSDSINIRVGGRAIFDSVDGVWSTSEVLRLL